MFDQRGTGESDALRCPSLEDFGGGGSASSLLARCATEIGPSRGAFTTQESVADIEAIRVAAGYEKLVLYGTSYGTKVALEYAERYPQHVEALVLDSVVPTNGPEPFAIPTFQAIAPVLRELCGQGACAGITSNPLADIAKLAARLRKHALSGSVYDGVGHRHSAHAERARPAQRSSRPATSTRRCGRCCPQPSSRRSATTPTRCCAWSCCPRA